MTRITSLSQLRPMRVEPNSGPTNPKIDTRLARQLAQNPNGTFTGTIKSTMTERQLKDFGKRHGFSINVIAGDIATFRNASAADIQALAKNKKVSSIQGSVAVQPTNTPPPVAG